MHTCYVGDQAIGDLRVIVEHPDISTFGNPIHCFSEQRARSLHFTGINRNRSPHEIALSYTKFKFRIVFVKRWVG